MASLSFLSARLLATRSTASVVWRTAVRRCCANVAAEQQLKDTVKPDNMQKRILVWTKTYAKIEDIPPRIKKYEMTRAMDRFRGRMMIVMMGLSFLGFYAMIVSGRRLRESGDSLTMRGTIQEQTWKEQGRLERQRDEGNQPK